MKIGELATLARTKVETVRFYEKAGLLAAPPRTQANYRSYCAAHVQRLSFIRRARDIGFSLDDVRELLTLCDDKDRPCRAVDAIATNHLAQIEIKIADLTRIGSELRRIIGECQKGSIGACKILETLSPVPIE